MREDKSLLREKPRVKWDWWSENPIEIVLVVFIIVAFLGFPRAGCGISETSPTQVVAQ